MSGLSPTSLSPSCLGWVYPRNHWASDQIPPPRRYQSTGSYSAPDPGSPTV